jgi:hypothetical protein
VERNEDPDGGPPRARARARNDDRDQSNSRRDTRDAASSIGTPPAMSIIPQPRDFFVFSPRGVWARELFLVA